MSNHNQLPEHSGEGIKTTLALFAAGVLLAGTGVMAKVGYDIVNVQPSVEHIYDNIVGTSHE